MNVARTKYSMPCDGCGETVESAFPFAKMDEQGVTYSVTTKIYCRSCFEKAVPARDRTGHLSVTYRPKRTNR
jgi:hypothetical protein